MCTKALIPTCSKTPSNSHTQRVAFCRHNVVVGGISSDLLREGNVGDSTLGGRGVTVVQVGVG